MPKDKLSLGADYLLWGPSLSAHAQRQTLTWRGLFVVGTFAVSTCPKTNSHLAWTICCGDLRCQHMPKDKLSLGVDYLLWGLSLSAQAQRQTLTWRTPFVVGTFTVRTCPKTNSRLARTVCCGDLHCPHMPKTNSRLARTICCGGLRCPHIPKGKLSVGADHLLWEASLSAHAQR